MMLKTEVLTAVPRESVTMATAANQGDLPSARKRKTQILPKTSRLDTSPNIP